MSTAVATVEEDEVEKLAPCDLTPQQATQWQETMSLMAWTCPGFRHLFYKLLSHNDGKYVAVPTRDVPVAATDAKNILINPDKFFEYTMKERVFILAHEVVHNVYDDVRFLHQCMRTEKVPMNDGTSLPFRNDIMQKSMDYRINTLLKDSRIGSVPKDALIDDRWTSEASVLDVYKDVYEDHPDNGGPGNIPGNQGGGPQGFDMLLAPGKSTGQNPGNVQRNQQQWGVEIANAQTLEQQNSQGKMPGSLKRMFQDLLEPEVPWTDHIQGIFNRRIGSGSYDWRRPDRRFLMSDVCMPSRSGHGAGWIVVWGDTSGSIGEEQLNSYMGELAGIIEEVKPRRLTILWCDSDIHRIDEVAEASDLLTIKQNGVGGGGGTECLPVFDWIATHTEVPEVFIGFTDGYCEPFPAMEPTFPTIWASVTDKKYPWGEVVRINTGPKKVRH